MRPDREGPVSHGPELRGFPAVLSDCLASGLIVLDADRRIAVCTPAAGRILGVTPTALLSQSFTSLPAPLHPVLEGDADNRPVEIQLTVPGRGAILVQVTTALERGPAGGPSREIGRAHV